MKVWRLLQEYAFVIIVMLVAGMVTGACAIEHRPEPVPIPPTCVQAIRLMPNWIKYWDTTTVRRWTL